MAYVRRGGRMTVRYPRYELYQILRRDYKTAKRFINHVRKNTDRTYRVMFGMDSAVEFYIARICEDNDLGLSEDDIAEITKDILENGL